MLSDVSGQACQGQKSSKVDCDDNDGDYDGDDGGDDDNDGDDGKGDEGVAETV